MQYLSVKSYVNFIKKNLLYFPDKNTFYSKKEFFD